MEYDLRQICILVLSSEEYYISVYYCFGVLCPIRLPHITCIRFLWLTYNKFLHFDIYRIIKSHVLLATSKLQVPLGP